MDDIIIRGAAIGAAAAVIAVGNLIMEEEDNLLENQIPREPHINADYERQYYINSLLFRGDKHCVEQLHMKLIMFNRLCDLLSTHNLLQPSSNMSLKEQVIIFLRLVGFNERFRSVSGSLFRSVETIHRYFRIVLKAVLNLYKHLIKDPDDDIPHKIGSNPRFYPYFKDCVGAIDGTHIKANVPIELQGKFRGRKDGTTQNVLAAINFDLKFTYVLSGWEGSAHDSRVLSDALSRPGGLKIPEGKYYMGDAGYGIRKGIISPYRGVRYHLKEFTGHRPENEQELFNLRHSSLRTSIERGFGILKGRFRSINNRPFWSYATQVDVVLATCILHNHIMGIDPNDHFMEEAVANASTRERASMSQIMEREEHREWLEKRDTIALDMWNDYNNRTRQ